MGATAAHTVRNSGKDAETTYGVSDHALTWSAGQTSGTLPFEEIEKVRLKTYSADISDPEDVHGQMILHTKSGTRLKVHSHHYVHIGSYASRVDTYSPFVRAFCQALAAANPNTRFSGGTPIMRVIYLILALACAVFTALFALALVFGEINRELLLGCSLSLTVTAAAWTLFKNAETIEFDGADLPSYLLPSQAAKRPD